MLAGRVLDIGCGTGEHALMCAAMGLDATGIDATPMAIGRASFASGWRIESIEAASFELAGGAALGRLSVIIRT